jgi:hypothetical protein
LISGHFILEALNDVIGPKNFLARIKSEESNRSAVLLHVKAAAINSPNPRDRPIALCYASERFGLFSDGKSCAEIQDIVPLHLECE